MDDKLRQLERIPVSEMSLEQVVALAKQYDRLGRDTGPLWLAYNQSLPPLPVIVRRWRRDSPSGLIVFFPTVPGGRYGTMMAVSPGGTFDADYNYLVGLTRPTNKTLHSVIDFVSHLERLWLDGRRCKIVQRNSYKFDKERLDAQRASNPPRGDEDLRRLERLAAQGDPAVMRALDQAYRRAGKVHVFSLNDVTGEAGHIGNNRAVVVCCPECGKTRRRKRQQVARGKTWCSHRQDK